jgi:hypothetical protein
MFDIFFVFKGNSRKNYVFILLMEIILNIFSNVITITINNIRVVKSIKHYFLMNILVIVIDSIFNYLNTKIYFIVKCLIFIDDIIFSYLSLFILYC